MDRFSGSGEKPCLGYAHKENSSEGIAHVIEKFCKMFSFINRFISFGHTETVAY